MNFVSLKARPLVGRACLTKQLRHSSCRACLNICPMEAIRLKNGQVEIDADTCTACGNCLFVCPGGALENLASPQRFYRETSLVAPFSVVPPTVEELLIWHAEYRIRSVEIDVERYPGWLAQLAALNVRLKQLDEPVWSITPPPEKNINSSRRRWLQLDKGDNASAAVSPAPRHRRACYAEQSEYALSLDRSRCFLCGACARICPQAAIEIGETALILHHARCTGCKACSDICLPQALSVEENLHASATQYAIQQAQCTTCHQPFLTWEAKIDKCHVCQHHAFGMREA